MELKVDLKISPKLKKLFDQPEEVMHKSIWSGMVNLVEEIEARAVKEVPVKSSNLMHSITSNVSADGKHGEIKATARYAEFVHRGTGLFGPFKQRIFPRVKKALFWPGAAHPVKSVKGQKPNPFFDRALRQIKPQRVFEDGVLGYLNQFGSRG
jgi:HK97 gp10 family phage protein